MQLKPNTELQGGKYRIIRVLGQGGFGITYLAENIFFEKKVAIKEFFPKDFCGRDNTSHITLGTQNNADTVTKLKARFLKEAKNIAKLNHPGIVKIHDIFEENDTAYYVMDYIEGANLNDIVKHNGALPETRAIEYIAKVGNALDYIHSHNMTHFDVKPANIVVRQADDEPILIDFGLSKQYDASGDATSTMMQGISQGFSPIELYNAGSVATFSPQTDVYSLGATLYYLIAGKTPPTASQVLEEGLSLPYSISQGTSSAIKRAMSVNRIKRYKSVRNFCRSLTKSTDASENTCETEESNIPLVDNNESEQTQLYGAPPIPGHPSNRIPEATKSGNGFDAPPITGRSNRIPEVPKSGNGFGAPPITGRSNSIPPEVSKSGNGLWVTVAMFFITIVVICIVVFARSNVNVSHNSHPGTFTDKSQLRVGDYIYGDNGYFSHEKLPDAKPSARVIGNDYYVKCITLIPVTTCKSEDVQHYASLFAQSHNNVRVPTVNDWRNILKNIYNLHEDSEYFHCVHGMFEESHNFTHYKYKAGDGSSNIPMVHDFVPNNAWCEDVYHLKKEDCRATFSLGFDGNRCENSEMFGEKVNALYLIYDL